MEQYPFSIRLFAPSGNPAGVLIATRDDWIGRAVIFPRELVREVQGRKEYSQPGFYILVSRKRMYIGEGDPVGNRIDSHIRNKDFWNRGVFFTSEGGRLNKAHVQHLESRLIELAKTKARVEMENLNRPTIPALSEEELAFAENFLRQVLLSLPLLGFWQFTADEEDGDALDETESEGSDEPDAVEVPGNALGRKASLYSSIPQDLQFTLTDRRGTFFAKARVADGGLVVKSGSTVANPTSERFELDSPGFANQRRQLTESGVIGPVGQDWAFTRDQFFSSGSAAASVVRGTHSALYWWRHEGGKNLGDFFQEAKAKRLKEAASRTSIIPLASPSAIS